MNLFVYTQFVETIQRMAEQRSEAIGSLVSVVCKPLLFYVIQYDVEIKYKIRKIKLSSRSMLARVSVCITTDLWDTQSNREQLTWVN